MRAHSESETAGYLEEYESLPSSVWSLGIHDAHCHPTDTMSTAPKIPSMKASGLIIMGTRFQDQSLVAELAEEYGVYDPRDPEESRGRVVPSFGYHPWFSHLIWDDEADDLKELSAKELKTVHYKRVLTSNPTDELIFALPEPKKLSEVLNEMREYLERFPVALVGEIGLDRGFRIPFSFETSFIQEQSELEVAGRASGQDEESRRLSPHRVSMVHQKIIFVAQLKLAGELGRAVSVHGVQCHGALFDTFRDLWKGHELVVESKKEMKRRRRKGKDGHEYLPDFAAIGDDSSEDDEDDDEDWLTTRKSNMPPPPAPRPKPFPPRVCLHSFSAPLQTLQQYLNQPTPKLQYPSQVYFSFSTTVNARSERGHMSKIMDTIKGVPNDRVLVESDLHTAGEDMDKALEGAVRLIAEVRGLEISDCASRLGANWREFVFGQD